MTAAKITLRVQIARLARNEAHLIEEVARLKAVLADERETTRRLRRLLKTEVKGLTTSFVTLRNALLEETTPGGVTVG